MSMVTRARLGVRKVRCAKPCFPDSDGGVDVKFVHSSSIRTNSWCFRSLVKFAGVSFVKHKTVWLCTTPASRSFGVVKFFLDHEASHSGLLLKTLSQYCATALVVKRAKIASPLAM